MQTSQQDTTFNAAFDKRLKRRYNAERRFKRLGLLAIFIALGFLVFLLSTIIGNGYSAFRQTVIQLDISFDKSYFPRCGPRPGRLPGHHQEFFT